MQHQFDRLASRPTAFTPQSVPITRSVDKRSRSDGERFASYFPTDARTPVLVKPPTEDGTAVGRLRFSRAAHGLAHIPAQRAFVILILKQDLTQSALWIDRCPRPGAVLRQGEVGVLNLIHETAAELESPFDFFYVYIPHRALDALSDQYGTPRITECALPAGVSTPDPVMSQLAWCLQPVLEEPHRADEPYAEYVILALQAHFARHYIVMCVEPKSKPGGLAQWQLRRAQEMLTAHMVGSVSIAQLAAECRLSACHFARSFQHSTGTSPHRWLTRRRLDKAADLLKHSALSIAEIALACGFADQSHLTRLFTSAHGIAPGRWRRAAIRPTHPPYSTPGEQLGTKSAFTSARAGRNIVSTTSLFGDARGSALWARSGASSSGCESYQVEKLSLRAAYLPKEAPKTATAFNTSPEISVQADDSSMHGIRRQGDPS